VSARAGHGWRRRIWGELDHWRSMRCGCACPVWSFGRDL
jgi:hypothetical protein